MSNDPLERLRELAKQLPRDLIASWRNTNHFEVWNTDNGEFFWLDLRDFGEDATTSGKRAGLLLDIAAEVSRLKSEGVL